jgi:hypothetical protein
MTKREHFSYWNKKTGKIVAPDILKHKEKKSIPSSQAEEGEPLGKLGHFVKNFDRQIKNAVHSAK